MKPLDIIVRFHDMRQLAELDRCIFSLVTQSYRPITILLATQRLSGGDIGVLNRRLAPLLAIDPTVRLKLENRLQEKPVDARTVLLNRGVEMASGRYLAFLDSDDTIWPNAYDSLVKRIEETKATICFATVCIKQREEHEEALLVTTKRQPFRGKGLIDLFRQNFCPIHSLVLDRRKVDAADLRFDTRLTRTEDYELLLRLCAKYRSDFGLVGTVVGDYYRVGMATAAVEHGPEWEAAQAYIAGLKRSTIVTPPVLQSLGMRKAGPVTIAEVVRLHAKGKDLKPGGVDRA